MLSSAQTQGLAEKGSTRRMGKTCCKPHASDHRAFCSGTHAQQALEIVVSVNGLINTKECVFFLSCSPSL